jgi:hypothetical protein
MAGRWSVGFLAWILSLATVSSSAAEYPALQMFLAPGIGEIAKRIDGRTVVVASRHVNDPGWPWEVHEAIGFELAAALAARGIDATRSARDVHTTDLSDSHEAFTEQDVKGAMDSGRDLLLTAELATPKHVILRLTLYRLDRAARLWRREVKVPPATLALASNIPVLNRKVVAYCQEHFGTPVGDGVCATLGSESLKAAGAAFPGAYNYGREMDKHEPILPGDILQLERVEMRLGKFSRRYRHHTSIVEEVYPNKLVVLHQNVAPKGKVVQRDTWPRDAFGEGIMVAYRPWVGTSPLPPVSPSRQEPPEVVRRDGTIDLMKVVDPEIDRVTGIWWFDDGTELMGIRATHARLQIPITPPERYTLKITLKRTVGANHFGIGLIVGGRQTQLSIDGYDGVTGLLLLDGRTSKENEGSYRGRVLPIDKTVQLEIRVRPTSVVLLADGKTIIEWSGNPARLSMSERYAMPRCDWLFLSSWNCTCRISEFLLVED